MFVTGCRNNLEDWVSGWSPLTFGILNQCIWDDDLQDKYEIQDSIDIITYLEIESVDRFRVLKNNVWNFIG